VFSHLCSYPVATVVETTPKPPKSDRVHTCIYLPRDVWRRLRAIAAAQDCKVCDLVMEAIEQVVAQRKP
jgi:predicted DNA-binding ribbon-helix-helix protein